MVFLSLGVSDSRYLQVWVQGCASLCDVEDWHLQVPASCEAVAQGVSLGTLCHFSMRVKQARVGLWVCVCHRHAHLNVSM